MIEKPHAGAIHHRARAKGFVSESVVIPGGHGRCAIGLCADKITVALLAIVVGPAHGRRIVGVGKRLRIRGRLGRLANCRKKRAEERPPPESRPAISPLTAPSTAGLANLGRRLSSTPFFKPAFRYGRAFARRLGHGRAQFLVVVAPDRRRCFGAELARAVPYDQMGTLLGAA